MAKIRSIALLAAGYIAGYLTRSFRKRDDGLGESASRGEQVRARPLANGWGVVGDRFPRFAEVLPGLLRTARGLTNRTVQTGSLADRVVFTLANIATEDFLEILVLAREGYGIGGLEVLRSLYERTVTLVYLSKNPQEAETFLAYLPIVQRKILNNAREVGQLPLLNLSCEQIAEIERVYERVKSDFEETLCKKCGSKRPRISWSSLDLASMARKADPGLFELYTTLYLYPTLHSHSTIPSVLSRVGLYGPGHFRYRTEAQPEHVRAALIGGHNLMLRVLRALNSYFSLNANGELEMCMVDFKKAWPDPTAK